MIIKKYNSFLINMICESILISTKDFTYIISKMSSDNKIAAILNTLINTDIKTTYNLLSLSDKNDEVSFIPDTQYQRILSSGENPLSKTKSKSKIGRMARQILADNGYSFTDSDIEKFVNTFKSTWDKENSNSRKVEVVKGDKILYWYNSDNYMDGCGTLGNSCMKPPSKNKYMEIYAKNKDKISMVVLVEDNKLLARALLWKLDHSSNNFKYYLDRIYYRNDSDYRYVYEWVLENLFENDDTSFGSHFNGTVGNISCDIKYVTFGSYPYADSMYYLYKKLDKSGKLTGDGKLTNMYDANSTEYAIFEMQDTGGDLSSKTHHYSERLDIYIKSTDAIYSSIDQTYYHVDDVIMCKALYDNILKSDAVYSKSMDDWIPKSRAITDDKYGVILDNYIVTFIKEYTGEDKNPFDISKKLANKDYSDFKLEKTLKNSQDIFNSSESRYGIKAFDKSLLVTDLWGYQYPIFLCFKVYLTTEEIEGGPLVFSYHSGNYVTEYDANFFNLKIDKNVTGFVYLSDLLSHLNHDFCFKFKNSYNKIDNTYKEEYNDFVKKIHDYRITNDLGYQRYFNSYEKFNRINSYEVICINIDKAWYQFDENRSIASILKSYNRSIPKDDFKVITKISKIYFSLYLINEDHTQTTNILKLFLKGKFDDYLSIITDFISDYHYTLYSYYTDFLSNDDELDDMSYRSFTSLCKSFLNEEEMIKYYDKKLF